nr:hypothetical protein [Tanacetum cinerariifolium]
MIDYVSIVETDKVIHTTKTDMVKLVVEIKSFGMSADELDKETGSSDGLQPKQAGLSCVHALNELHLYEIHVVPNMHEVDQYSYDELFTLKLHHGRFTRLPGRRYNLGEISYLDLIDCHLLFIEGNMPRFKEVDVYVEEDFLVVEQHMIEVRFINEHSKGLVIREIVQEVGLNEVAREYLGNKWRIHQKMSTPLDECCSGVNVCFSDFNDDKFPYMFAKCMKQETKRRIPDQFALRDLLAEVGNKTADINEKLTNEVELELEEEIAVAKIFVDLYEAYKEDVDSYLDEALVLEEFEDLGMFDNLVDDDSVDVLKTKIRIFQDD